MPLTVPTLAGELSAEIPAYDGVPTDYEKIVKHALNDYGQRRPLTKEATISVVSGTAAYTLPNGFLDVISLTGIDPKNPAFIDNSGYIIPTGGRFDETWRIAGGQITFYPTPQYTLDRTLVYKSGYYVDGDNITDLTDQDWSIALFFAQSLVLLGQANKAARNAFQYAAGAERISKEKQAAEMRAQSKQLKNEYTSAISKAAGGVAGMRSSYSTLERDGYV